MADTTVPFAAELGLDETPVEIVSASVGRPGAVLHALPAWRAPGYMIALALALAEGGWNPFPSLLCGVHLLLTEGNGLLTSIYAYRVTPDGRRRLLGAASTRWSPGHCGPCGQLPAEVTS